MGLESGNAKYKQDASQNYIFASQLLGCWNRAAWSWKVTMEFLVQSTEKQTEGVDCDSSTCSIHKWYKPTKEIYLIVESLIYYTQ